MNENKYDKNELIKITITDNLGNGKKASTLQKAINEEILNKQTGELERTNLGFKEMKIAAAFLRGTEPFEIKGNKLSDNEPEILKVENEGGNLQFIFYLLKPKEILIIDNSDSWKNPSSLNELKEKGIDIEKPEEINFAHKLRHRFCIINTDLNGISNLSWELFPYRLFYFGNKTNKNVCPEYAIQLDNTNIGQLRKCTAENMIVKIYNLWITKFWGKTSLPNLVYYLAEKTNIFENKSEIPISNTQEINVWKKTEQELKNNNALNEWIYFRQHFESQWKCPDGNTNKCRYEEQNELCIYHMLKNRVANKLSSPLMIESITGSNSSKRKFTEKCEHLELLCLELIEAAYTKIIIADERIFSIAKNKNLQEILDWKGIMVIDLIKKKNGNFCFKDMNGEELAEINWNTKGNNYKIKPSKNNLSGYTFLCIHQGLIDKVIEGKSGSKKDLIEKFIKELQQICNFLVIHSGRGKPKEEEIPQGVRFMNYTELENCFYDDKHTLVQVLFNLKGG